MGLRFKKDTRHKREHKILRKVPKRDLCVKAPGRNGRLKSIFSAREQKQSAPTKVGARSVCGDSPLARLARFERAAFRLGDGPSAYIPYQRG